MIEIENAFREPVEYFQVGDALHVLREALGRPAGWSDDQLMKAALVAYVEGPVRDHIRRENGDGQYAGPSRPMSVPPGPPCPHCGGRRTTKSHPPDRGDRECLDCAFLFRVDDWWCCNECRGTGRGGTYRCDPCRGTGLVPADPLPAWQCYTPPRV